jgi:hypothetical protein
VRDGSEASVAAKPPSSVPVASCVQINYWWGNWKSWEKNWPLVLTSFAFVFFSCKRKVSIEDE